MSVDEPSEATPVREAGCRDVRHHHRPSSTWFIVSSVVAGLLSGLVSSALSSSAAPYLGYALNVAIGLACAGLVLLLHRMRKR